MPVRPAGLIFSALACLTLLGCSNVSDPDFAVSRGGLDAAVDGCFEVRGTVHTVSAANGAYSDLSTAVGEEIVVRYEFDWPHAVNELSPTSKRWEYFVDETAQFTSSATIGGAAVTSGCTHTTAFDDIGQVDQMRIDSSGSWSIQDWQSSAFGSGGCQSNAITTLSGCAAVDLSEPRAPHPEDCSAIRQVGLLGFTPTGTYIVRGEVESIVACGATDSDDDGVLDGADLCDGTTADTPTRRLGTNRFADVNGDGVFDTTLPNGNGPGKSYTLADTGGCSCAQIIDALGLGRGHEKFGCSISAMDEWVAIANGL